MAMTDVLRLDDALRGEDVSGAELRRLHCGSCSYDALGGLVPVIRIRSIVLGVVGARLRLGTLLLWILRRCCLVLLIHHVHVFVADAIKSFDIVDRGISESVFSCLGLLAWFRHAFFLVSCVCAAAVLSLLLDLVSRGLGMEAFRSDAP